MWLLLIDSLKVHDFLNAWVSVFHAAIVDWTVCIVYICELG